MSSSKTSIGKALRALFAPTGSAAARRSALSAAMDLAGDVDGHPKPKNSAAVTPTARGVSAAPKRAREPSRSSQTRRASVLEILRQASQTEPVHPAPASTASPSPESVAPSGDLPCVTRPLAGEAPAVPPTLILVASAQSSCAALDQTPASATPLVSEPPPAPSACEADPDDEESGPLDPDDRLGRIVSLTLGDISLDLGSDGPCPGMPLLAPRSPQA